MKMKTRIERALYRALKDTDAADCPPRLAAAIRDAVFPGGARLRPRLCLAVAGACGEDDPTLAEAAASAIELLHCASLVHDDMPSFDNAAFRRGKVSIHRAFGEPIALLTGDALIVAAFRNLVQETQQAPERLGRLVTVVSEGVGVPGGIVAGQAWECEPEVPLANYQRAKTGALFAAATQAGAAAAGADPRPWRTFGEQLGEAFQVADDLHDVAADPDDLGKPVGQDAALGRPSAARELGLQGALEHFDACLDEALRGIPACPGREALEAYIATQARQFLPTALAPSAA